MRTLRPEEEWIPLPDGTVPAIVDEETWDEVQRQLEYSKARAARNNKHPEKSLCRGGHVICGRCGAHMFFKKSKRSDAYDRYVCTSKVMIVNKCDNGTILSQVIDEAVWEHCLELLQQPHKIEAGLNKRYAMQNPNQASLESAERVILKTGAKIQNLMEQLEDEGDKEVQRLIRLRIASLTEEKKVWNRSVISLNG